MISRCISSGWYHHVWCILHTDNVSNGMWNTRVCQCCLFSYVYQQALKGVGCDKPASVTIAVAFFWWGCEYWYFCWQTHTVNWSVVVCFELCYWLARSFSRASHRCTSLFCHWVLVHGWLILCVKLCQDDATSREFSTLTGYYTHTNHFWYDSWKFYYDHHLWYLILSSRGMKDFWYWLWTITALIGALWYMMVFLWPKGAW